MEWPAPAEDLRSHRLSPLLDHLWCAVAVPRSYTDRQVLSSLHSPIWQAHVNLFIFQRSLTLSVVRLTIFLSAKSELKPRPPWAVCAEEREAIVRAPLILVSTPVCTAPPLRSDRCTAVR